ncbi:MAG: lytic murein transglycosylase [Geminicoccaceae bacterium]
MLQAAWVVSVAVGAIVWTIVTVGPLAAADSAFDDWLEDLRTEAESAGISQATIEAALSDLKPIPEVVTLDRRQPEGQLTFQEYKRKVLSKARVEKGRALLKKHRSLLHRIAADYNVQPRFIIALWGIETSYGSFLGGHDVVPALATLAYDGRRAKLFRSELIAALRILDRGDVMLEDMRGSWAGAMGQSQFMPSSFLRFAVDYDGDGKRDIWNSLPDVFASIANYLSKAGWDNRYTWGRQVKLASAKKDPAEVKGLKIVKTLPEWQSMGIRRKNGRSLPSAAVEASLLHTDDGDGPAYLVYGNFRVLMIWNRSTYFALTVSELSDLIISG